MRFFFLIILILCANFPSILNAQTIIEEFNKKPKSFWGIGIGINDYGIGVGSEIPINKSSCIIGNLGVSTWGGRLNGGFLLYPNEISRKTALSISYSYASGITNFNPSLDVESSSGTSHREVELQLNAISTINLTYLYNIKVSKNSKLVLSGGYSICLTNELYKNNSSYTLTDKSKNFIKLMAPGGIIFGIKFMSAF